MPHLVYSLRDDTPHTRHATDWTAPLRQKHAEQINNLTGTLVLAEHDAICVRAHLDFLAARLGQWVQDGGVVSVDLLADVLVESVRPAQRRIGALIDTVRAES